MKLFCETTEQVKVLKENKGKDYYIEGIFLQANLKNQNGRMYPLHILQKEVTRYSNDFINEGRALGELGHPEGPSINLDRVSHIIRELRQDGNNFIGKAKILDTPFGKIVKNFIDEGVKLGVSSRGMGSLKHTRDGIDEVQEDFMLATPADIVADPSAPNAFVNGIMEGKSWVWENGVVREEELDKIKSKISNATMKQLEEKKIEAFTQFIKRLL